MRERAGPRDTLCRKLARRLSMRPPAMSSGCRKTVPLPQSVSSQKYAHTSIVDASLSSLSPRYVRYSPAFNHLRIRSWALRISCLSWLREAGRFCLAPLGKTTPGVNIVTIVRLANQDVIYEFWGPPMTALIDCIDWLTIKNADPSPQTPTSALQSLYDRRAEVVIAQASSTLYTCKTPVDP